MISMTNILSSATLSTLVLILLLWLLRKLFLESISKLVHTKIQSKHDQQLETHKAELAIQNEVSLIRVRKQIQDQQFLNESIRSSFSEGQKSSMDRRLRAIDQLWTEVMTTRNIVPQVMTIVDVLKENETTNYTDYLNKAKQKGIATLWTGEEFKKKMQSMSDSIESDRPYIGEYLWAVFRVYRTIHARVCLILQLDEFKEDEVVKWYKDEVNQRLISTILHEEEFETFNNMEYGKFVWLQRTLETKMLTQMEKIISGESYGDEAQRKLAIVALKEISETETDRKDIGPTH